ncbi:MAG TPA: Gfo/Idh/MocA family oxidoreductase [Acidimicrobiia bacterium]|nr:Gfo/Idh/MocA family oxidoreductase [Acidimicrobiia bacterium]
MIVRFAVVGCGTAARHLHLPALRAAGVDVTVFASRSSASAERARDEWGTGQVVERWEDAVARDDVDAVVIATPNAQHAPVAIAAAVAGKHVLVDKPIACTAAEADAMIAAATAHGTVLVPFHNTRFAAPFVAARDAVSGGRIGTLTGFRVAFGHAGPQHWAPEATWFFDPAVSGGGCLVDLGVHAVDLVRAVTADDVIEVAAALTRHHDGVEHDAQLLARLAGGAMGSVHVSWTARPGPDHQLTLFGDAGTLHLDGRTPLTWFPADGGARERVELPDVTSSPLEELLAAIRGERNPSVTARDGRAAIAVVDAAYRAAERRQFEAVS